MTEHPVDASESAEFSHLFKAAAQRSEVELPGGTRGMLMYITPTSHMAKVRAANRHVRIHASLLTLVEH